MPSTHSHRIGQARFRHYRHDPEDPRSLGEGTIYSILEDQAGVLWVGTAGGGLYRFDRDTETFSCYKHDPEDADSLSDNTIFAIHEDSEGRALDWHQCWSQSTRPPDRHVSSSTQRRMACRMIRSLASWRMRTGISG